MLFGLQVGEMSMSPTDLQVARARAVDLATRVLEGLESPLVAARELSMLRFSVGLPDDDADFLAFAGVDSETDALPIGQARKHWAPAALAEKAEEIARAEKWALDFAGEALRNIVRRFGGAG
jgi:hypothetical protein